MQEIRKIAVIWNVDVRVDRTKRDIIPDIPLKEGFPPCFATKETCNNGCMWKTDCLGKKR
jgi:hypothetical protein